MTDPTFLDVLRARRVIRPFLQETPLFSYPGLDALVGAEVWIKHENYHPTGAFKVRGGINFLANLDAEQRQRGVITASTGNHGQSIAYAGKLLGVRAVVVVPEKANPVKVQAMKGWGAEVIHHGPDFEASKRHASQLAQEQGLRFISSGDEPWLIAGVATHTLEILEQQPDLDALIVPMGGGSGVAGACLVAETVNPKLRVIAVGAEGAPAARDTWKARDWRTAPINTVAQGLATGEPFMMPQRILWRHLDDFVLVSDAELKVCVRHYLEHAKTLAEPAGASGLAAALRGGFQGQKIAIILSGGNIAPAELVDCLR